MPLSGTINVLLMRQTNYSQPLLHHLAGSTFYEHRKEYPPSLNTELVKLWLVMKATDVVIFDKYKTMHASHVRLYLFY